MHEPMQSYRNRLLQLLSREELNRMRQYLKPVVLKYRQVLYEPDVPIKDVYFPTTGVVSIVHTMRDGSAAEVGTIGNEGVVGLPILLGDAQAPTGAYVQVPGSGLQLAVELFRQQLAGLGSVNSSAICAWATDTPRRVAAVTTHMDRSMKDTGMTNLPLPARTRAPSG